MKNIQKALPLDRPMVFVDHRESSSNVTRHLKEYDILITPKQLEVGDYICSDQVGVERKTMNDFLQSIIDKRLFNQLENLSNTFEKPILIMEGNPDVLFLNRNMHTNAIRGALACIAVDYSMPIIWTQNSRETASQIYWIAHREQIDDRKEASIRCNKKAFTLKQQQEYLIAGLPGINTSRAKKLLEHFKTPERIFRASEEKLKKVNGFGDKTAKRIKDLLKRKYKE